MTRVAGVDGHAWYMGSTLRCMLSLPHLAQSLHMFSIIHGRQQVPAEHWCYIPCILLCTLQVGYAP
jgi:hypothetical protein